MHGLLLYHKIVNMKPEEIKFGDWMRMFVGNAPPEFFIEIIIRIVFIFILLVIAMRFMGLRMAAQLNRIEMISLFSLAAAIGVPLQAPDRGLLPAVVIAVIVVAIGHLVATISFHNQKFEQLAEDDYTTLVKDGVLQMNRLKKTRMTVERLLAQLRSESIRHLGEVKRLYFEAKGSFTLIKEEQPKPGLAVIPASDTDFLNEQKQDAAMVCRTCGARQETADGYTKRCSNCKDDKWLPAIL
jgi:uncharacterized membrane protein YcaP (DUF421 family)